jgi:dephospho-CoA kinase
MIESQIPISKKKKYAHFVIDNNSTLENTFNQVKEVIKCIKHDGFKRNY